MITKKTKIQAFKHSLVIEVFKDSDELRLNEETASENTLAVTTADVAAEVKIKFIENEMSTGVIAHESYHAACYIIENLGDTTDHSEVIAYLIEFISDYIDKNIKK